MGNNLHYWLSNSNSICNQHDLYVLDLSVIAEFWLPEGCKDATPISMEIGETDESPNMAAIL